jgi:hypothetical protein
MMNMIRSRRRAANEGRVSNLAGEYRMAVVSGALTTVAAGTTTAGHVFSFRNPDLTKKILLRYLAIDFNLTTAFGAGQAMGFDVIVATGYSASHTGGTAIDMGSTLVTAARSRRTRRRRLSWRTRCASARPARSPRARTCCTRTR